MKKFSCTLLVLVASAVQAFATDEITTADLSIPQGGTERLMINLSNPDGNYGGFQFDLKLPEGVSATAVQKAARLTAIEGYSLEMNLSDADNNIYTVLGYNSNRQSIAGTSGTIVYVTLSANASMTTVNEQLSAQLKNVTLSTIDLVQTDVANSTFTITIDEPRTVLDENSTAAPEPSDGLVDVRVKRTIKANEWSTICLPFAMSTEQLDAAFGEMGTGWMLADFQGYETIEDDEENIVGISINFGKATAIEANHPYLIKVSEAVSSFTVDGVEIDPEDEPTVAAVNRTKKQWSEFIGTYQAQMVVEKQMLFLSGNKFYYSNGTTKMKAFRGYFDFYDVLSEVENANSRVRLVWDGQATTIAEIDAPNVLKGAVYNLNGQFMGTGVDLKSLPKGIYTVDGKKVVNY